MRTILTVLPPLIACLIASASADPQAELAKKPGAKESEAKNGPTLRVMTYNIHHGEGTDKVFDLERLANVINARRPDLVAVQEVDVKTTRSSGVDQAAELARLTSMHYAFGKFMDFQGGEYGQMVLSRFPIISARNFGLPPGPEPRTALAIEVSAPTSTETNEKIVFVGNHFYATELERSDQAKQLVKLLQPEIKAGTPIVIAGDFNSTPRSKTMQILRKVWVDPTLKKHRRTWPSDRPRVEIDHILYRPAKRFKFIKSKTFVEKVASDHRPVLTVLELKNKSKKKSSTAASSKETPAPK